MFTLNPNISKHKLYNAYSISYIRIISKYHDQFKTEHVRNVQHLSGTFRKEIVQRITRNLLDIQIMRLVQMKPMWGYMIKKEAETKFEVKLGHGALYPLLNSLEKNSYLTSKREQKGGRTRKI
jgi:hypothetical protein